MRGSAELPERGRATDPIAERALATLRSEDAEAATVAERMLGTLLEERFTLPDLTQYRLQAFLWFEVPYRLQLPLNEGHTVALALGRLLELAALPRYASLCRSETTRRVLAAYERGPDTGFSAFRRAEARTGVAPPDTPTLRWGRKMGRAESHAYVSAAGALELAVRLGDVRPGARRWQEAQAAVTEHHLTMPLADGRTYVELVTAERVDAWAGAGNDERRRLVAPLVEQVRAPANVPSDPCRRLRALLQFLEDGRRVRATAAVEAAASWTATADGMCAEATVILALRMGVVHRRARRYSITQLGRELLSHEAGLWRTAARHVCHAGTFTGVASELTLAVLLEQGTADIVPVARTVMRILEGDGWQDRQTGDGPDLPTIGEIGWYLARLLQSLDGAEISYIPGEQRLVRLTEAGRATALEALRARATGPRSS